LIDFLGSHCVAPPPQKLKVAPFPGTGQELLQLAAAHHVIPLLYRGLAAVDGSPGPELTAICATTFFEVVARNLVIERELFRLLGRLDAAKVRAMPFKGPALGHMAYGDTLQRQYDDLDLLIDRADILKARDLLLAEGYEPVHALSPLELAFQVRNGWDICLRHRETGIPVELGSRLAPDPYAINIGATDLFALAETGPCGPGDALRLPPPVVLVCLSMHAGKHLWQRLVWLCDIAALLARYADLDASRAREFARQHGVSRLLESGLALLRQAWPELAGTLESRMPAHADKCADSLATEYLSRLTAGIEKKEAPGDMGDTLSLNLRSRERGIDRCRILARLVFAPTISDLRCFPLPAWLEWLYLFTRPVRLIMRLRAGKQKAA